MNINNERINSERINNERINNERINQILTQTNYTETEAIVKLQAHNGDAIEVIREYMGLKPRATTEKKQIKSQELNQEIFFIINLYSIFKIKKFFVKYEKRWIKV